MIWCSGSCEVHSLHDKKDNWSSSCSSFVLLTEICIYGSIRWPWETTKKCPLANPHPIFIFLVTATRICHPHPHRAVKSFSLSYLLGSNVERNGIAIKLACLLHYPSGWKVISLSSRWSWMDAAPHGWLMYLVFSTLPVYLSVCRSVWLSRPIFSLFHPSAPIILNSICHLFITCWILVLLPIFTRSLFLPFS